LCSQTDISLFSSYSFNTSETVLFGFIKQICNYLPCPECANHATRFLSGVKTETVNNKESLRKIIFILHQNVNMRKQKKSFAYNDLEIYKSKNIINVFNNFVNSYKSTTGNMKLLTDGFQRQMIVKEFRKWFLKNFKSFK
jgi:hypothetical protein